VAAITPSENDKLDECLEIEELDTSNYSDRNYLNNTLSK